MVKNLRNDQKLPAVANYGVRPTLEKSSCEPLLEIHLLVEPDTEQWRTGVELHMELDFFLQPEKAFAALDDLKLKSNRTKIRLWGAFNPVSGRQALNERAPSNSFALPPVPLKGAFGFSDINHHLSIERETTNLSGDLLREFPLSPLLPRTTKMISSKSLFACDLFTLPAK